MTGFIGGYKVLLAPMAGVTDIAMRTICRRHGADIAFTEMVSAKGLSYASDKTRALLRPGPEEDALAVQLFGHEPDILARQASFIEDEMGSSLAYLDINMGCPARKIVTKGDGSALMKDPETAAAIVSEVKGAVSCPVTVKFRRGWSEGGETCVEFAKRMEDAGADGCVVHGRFAMQMYRGLSDRGAIARVKRAVSIPVVGNGDIRCGEDACSMMEQTGCDAVMIARGAEGNPWIFDEVKAALEGREAPAAPSVSERIEAARTHAALLAGLDGRQIVRMRKHAMWYVAGMPGAAVARRAFNDCISLDDFERVFDMLLETAAEHEGGAVG